MLVSMLEETLSGIKNAFASKFKRSMRVYIFTEEEYKTFNKNLSSTFNKDMVAAKKEGFEAARELDGTEYTHKTFEDVPKRKS